MEEEKQVPLKNLLNSIIVVKAKDGRRFRGKLMGYDASLNLVLEDVEELSNDEPATKLKLVLIKGGNVSTILRC